MIFFRSKPAVAGVQRCALCNACGGGIAGAECTSARSGAWGAEAWRSASVAPSMMPMGRRNRQHGSSVDSRLLQQNFSARLVGMRCFVAHEALDATLQSWLSDVQGGDGSYGLRRRHRPVVTPHELSAVSCEPRWSGDRQLRLCLSRRPQAVSSLCRSSPGGEAGTLPSGR